jgi:hypothetical protein
MSTSLTRRVYLAAPVADQVVTRLLAKQVALKSSTINFHASLQATAAVAARPTVLSATDHRAMLTLGIMGELMEYLFGIDFLMLIFFQ